MRFTAAKIPLSLFSEGLMTIFWMPDTLLRKHIEVLTLNNLIILMRMFLKINLEHTIMSVCTDNKQYTLFTFWDISWKQHITSKQRVHAQEESPVHPGRSIWAFCRRCGFDGFIRLLTLTLAGAVDSQMWSGWDENQHLQIWDDDPQSGKGEVTFPGRGWEPAPKWRSSIKSGSSRVRGGWKGRSTGGSELSWMRKISITGWAWFPPSPMVMICGLRPKEQDHGFKWPKLIFFASRGASWGGWGIGLGCLVDAPLMRCSRHNPMGRDI